MQSSASPKSEKSRVSRAAGIVSFFTLISRVMGLVRDMVLARFFGSGVSADAFFVAFRIPNLLRRLFAEGSLTIAFIPVFTEYLTQKGRKEAFDVARTILTLLALVLSVSALLGVLLSPWIVRIQAFGFGGSGDRYELTVLLTRITFPYIFFISLVAFFMGVLNSLRHFGAPAAAPIFLNVGIIGAAYLISPHCPQPIVGIALGVLIGGILQVGLQIPWALKEGLKIFPLWQPDHPAVRKIGLLMLPAIVGSAVYQFNQFMGTLLASFLPEGSVSWLYYADRLVQFPLGIFAIAISTAALPSLSAQAAMQDLDEFQDTLSYSLRLVFFVTLPCVIGLIVLGKPIIRIFFERGAFDSQSTIMTNKALFFYSVGLWAFSGIRVMVSAFYALQDTKTPVKVAIVAAVANLVFSLAFMGPLKHGGLALALSLASSLQFCLLVFFFKRKVPIGKLRAILVSVSKSILAAASMGVGIYCLHSMWLSTHSNDGFWGLTIKLGALLLGGIAIYFLVARVIGCRELGSLLDMLRPGVRARGRGNRASCQLPHNLRHP